LFATSKDKFFQRPVWLPDGHGLLVLSGGGYLTQVQIVYVSFPAGKFSSVTRDTSSYDDLDLAADGHTLATIESQTHVNSYLLPATASGAQARPFTVEGSLSNNVSWTRDGQLMISAAAGGLTLLNPGSGSKTPLAAQLSSPITARACSDGHIVLSALTGGKMQRNIWRVDADGGNPVRLTSGKFDYLPVCSPETKTVLYDDADGKLEKVPLEGGTSQLVGEFGVFSLIAVSPDGELAVFVAGSSGDRKEGMALVRLDSSQPPRRLEFERSRSEFVPAYGDAAIRFSADGKGIVYPIRNGDTDNLWLQYLDGSPGKQITDFNSELIRDFDYSFDGKQLAIIRGHRESDVVLLREEGK